MSAESESEISSIVEKETCPNPDDVSDLLVTSIAIRKYEENAKSALKEAIEAKASIVNILAEAQSKLAEISTARTDALAAKTKIDADQTVIATKSSHIHEAQEHADKVRANLDRELTAATKHATDCEGQKTRAQTAADNATELLTNVRTTKATSETDAESIATARKTAEESTAIIKTLATKSTTIEKRVADYETELATLKESCASQLKVIEGLLPGATSAGLAHSFDTRRQTFLAPHNIWQFVFVGSVLTIGGVALTGLWPVSGTIPTLDELGRLWLARLPFMGPLIWLAIHASREAAQAKRLEEDYGFKAATSACFEGFRVQMSQVGKDTAPDSPLARLCADALRTIASPPGRIYDKQNLTVTPTGEFIEATKSVADLVKSKPSQANNKES
jgi:hypothetical protein